MEAAPPPTPHFVASLLGWRLRHPSVEAPPPPNRHPLESIQIIFLNQSMTQDFVSVTSSPVTPSHVWCAQNQLNYRDVIQVAQQYIPEIEEIEGSLVISFLIPDSAREKISRFESRQARKRKIMTRERQENLDSYNPSVSTYFRFNYYRYDEITGKRRFVRYLNEYIDKQKDNIYYQVYKIKGSTYTRKGSGYTKENAAEAKRRIKEWETKYHLKTQMKRMGFLS